MFDTYGMKQIYLMQNKKVTWICETTYFYETFDINKVIGFNQLMLTPKRAIQFAKNNTLIIKHL